MVAPAERQRVMSGESARGVKGNEVPQYMGMPRTGMQSLRATRLPYNGCIICDEGSMSGKVSLGERWHRRVQAPRGFSTEQAGKGV